MKVKSTYSMSKGAWTEILPRLGDLLIDVNSWCHIETATILWSNRKHDHQNTAVWARDLSSLSSFLEDPSSPYPINLWENKCFTDDNVQIAALSPHHHHHCPHQQSTLLLKSHVSIYLYVQMSFLTLSTMRNIALICGKHED